MNLIILILSSAYVDAKGKRIVFIVKGSQLSSSIRQCLSVNLTSHLYESMFSFRNVRVTCYVKNNIQPGVETRQYVRKQFHLVGRARTSD